MGRAAHRAEAAIEIETEGAVSARIPLTTLPAPLVLSTSVQAAASIPSLTHAEAGWLAATELQRFLALVDSLAAGDWDQPTACTRWNVQQVTAHVAGPALGSRVGLNSAGNSAHSLGRDNNRSMPPTTGRSKTAPRARRPS
jgi:hypothetical protein